MIIGARDKAKIRPRPGPPPFLPEGIDPNAPMAPPPPAYTAPPPPLERPSRGQELDEAKSAYLQQTPGRFKSGLRGALQGALQGLATGQGLGGAIGGALGGGLVGAVNPRGLREQQFNQEIAPKIQQRWGMEDQDRAAQRQAGIDFMNAQKTQAEIGAIDRSNQPRAPRPPSYGNAPGIGIYNEQTGEVTTPAPPKEEKQPRYVKAFGRNRQTGRYSYYNAADKADADLHDPAPPLQRPKAAGKAKKEPQYVSISKVREFAEKQGISVSEAKARAKADGFTVVN